MKLLDKYIGKMVLSSILLVTAVLVALNGFILLVNQLGDIGKGQFGLLQAAFVVLLSVPYQVYLFFPVASLVGSLLGLGLMAHHHELIVIRAAGVSIGAVTRAVLKVALVLIVVMSLLGETIVPFFSTWARHIKTQALEDVRASTEAIPRWFRVQNDFIVLGEVLSPQRVSQVVQFHFNAQHQLQFARRIDELQLLNGLWQAKGVHETHLNEDKTITKNIPEMPWDVALNPRYVYVSPQEPDEMGLAALHTYIKNHQHEQTIASHYQLIFWQRLIQPLTTVVMMILAIPFIFGPLRSSSMGLKLMIGISIGFGFHLINRFFGPISQVLQWPSLLAALLPTLLFGILSMYLLARARR